MRMVCVVAALSLVVGVASGVRAQGPPSAGANDPNRWYKLPAPGEGDRFTPVLAKMKLDKRQIAKLRPFIARANGDRAGAMKDKKLSPEDRKKRIQTSDDQVWRMAMSVLTADQKPAFEAAMKKAGFTPSK